MDRIGFRRRTDAASFTMLSNLVLLDTSLSDGAKVTYLVLLYHARAAGACFPGQETLAAERGVSERSVREHLKELRARGLISVERRGKAKTNLYWIEDLEALYRKKTSDQEDDRKFSSAGDRKKTSAPILSLKNTKYEEETETLNVPEPMHMHVFAEEEVQKVAELTGDHKSLRRYAQLYAICTESGWGSLWSEALRSLNARTASEHRLGEVRSAGAYFCATLARLLTERGVAVPVGTKAEREEVRSLLQASLLSSSDTES